MKKEIKPGSKEKLHSKQTHEIVYSEFRRWHHRKSPDWTRSATRLNSGDSSWVGRHRKGILPQPPDQAISHRLNKTIPPQWCSGKLLLQAATHCEVWQYIPSTKQQPKRRGTRLEIETKTFTEYRCGSVALACSAPTQGYWWLTPQLQS